MSLGMINLSAEQASQLKYPPGCPVYICDENEPCFLLTHGKVDMAILQLSGLGLEAKIHYYVLVSGCIGGFTTGSSSGATGTGTASDTIENSATGGTCLSAHDVIKIKVPEKRLRYRTGCTVAVTVTGESVGNTHTCTNTVDGIIRGVCDTSEMAIQSKFKLEDDAKSFLLSDTFSYSIELLTDKDAASKGGACTSKIVHDIKPDNVTYRPVLVDAPIHNTLNHHEKAEEEYEGTNVSDNPNTTDQDVSAEKMEIETAPSDSLTTQKNGNADERNVQAPVPVSIVYDDEATKDSTEHSFVTTTCESAALKIIRVKSDPGGSDPTSASVSSRGDAENNVLPIPTGTAATTNSNATTVPSSSSSQQKVTPCNNKKLKERVPLKRKASLKLLENKQKKAGGFLSGIIGIGQSSTIMTDKKHISVQQQQSQSSSSAMKIPKKEDTTPTCTSLTQIQNQLPIPTESDMNKNANVSTTTAPMKNGKSSLLKIPRRNRSSGSIERSMSLPLTSTMLPMSTSDATTTTTSAPTPILRSNSLTMTRKQPLRTKKTPAPNPFGGGGVDSSGPGENANMVKAINYIRRNESKKNQYGFVWEVIVSKEAVAFQCLKDLFIGHGGREKHKWQKLTRCHSMYLWNPYPKFHTIAMYATNNITAHKGASTIRDAMEQTIGASQSMTLGAYIRKPDVSKRVQDLNTHTSSQYHSLSSMGMNSNMNMHMGKNANGYVGSRQEGNNDDGNAYV